MGKEKTTRIFNRKTHILYLKTATFDKAESIKSALSSTHYVEITSTAIGYKIWIAEKLLKTEAETIY